MKLSKVGNSIKMTIPQPIMWVLGWKEGDTLEVDFEGDKMVVTKHSNR